ncbi:hypothetical protein [Candidatus Skiveiella danica]
MPAAFAFNTTGFSAVDHVVGHAFGGHGQAARWSKSPPVNWP